MPSQNRLLIQQPSAIIMARITWRPAPPLPLPVILPRMEFDPSVFSSFNRGGAQPLPTGNSPINSPQPVTSPESAPSSTSLSGSASKRPLIPKPAGEPGRPKSGGFSLKQVLIDLYDWSLEDYKLLNRIVRELARKTLSTKVSYRSQNEKLVNRICEKVTETHFPRLVEYEDCWPVRSALKLSLKSLSEVARRGKKANTGRYDDDDSDDDDDEEEEASR